MERVYNFSAGPACLPEEVLVKAASELINYGNTGMSVMEMSHRTAAFDEIINSAERLLRKLMSIPNHYKVLFLQGGASAQFAAIPMNLFRKSMKADFVHTGFWTQRAIPEARKYGTVNIIASSEDKTFNYIPKLDPATFDREADYFYICSNNTIYGTHYSQFPNTGSVPLVADMSSHILSERINVEQFGLIFAGAQKNIGPAGLTIVIIRDDLIDQCLKFTPTILRYKTHADNNSMYHTPPTFAIYIAKLVFEWLDNMGGVDEIHKVNEAKARMLYEFLDESKLFKATVHAPEDRSLMNVPFITGSDDIDKAFIKEAEKNGLVTLKGHRSVGGMRASLYNAMPLQGVSKLVSFMKKFEMDNRC